MLTTDHAPRLGGTLSALILAPMVAHTTWRAAAVALGSATAGRSLAVSLSAVAVAALAGAACWRAPRPAGLPQGAVLGAALVLGLGVSGMAGAVSLLGVGAATLLALPRVIAALSSLQDTIGAPAPAALITWSVMALGCAAGSVDLATYLGDPSVEGHGIYGDGIIHRHLCLSAYLHAAELIRSGIPNVYDLSLIPAAGSGVLPETAQHMAPFELDRFGYPPQFLLLPLALIAVIDDFTVQRAVWTCLNALVFAAALWRVGLWVGPRSGRILRWTAPALWLLGGATYQAGNIQLPLLGLGVLAMIAFDEQRERVGGALLAGVTLAKIAPGLLGVLLLVQRRWRGVGWTVAVAVALSGLTLLVVGPEPFEAFLEYHLPRVSSGVAYDFLDDTPRLIFENLSPFGLPFKLAELGVGRDPWVWGPRFASAYTVAAFLLTVLVGRRTLDRRGHAAVWMLILTIAALRSPMGPGYLLAGVFWALALTGAEVQDVRGRLIGGLLVAAMMLTTPFAPINMWAALAGQAVMHGVIVWLLLRTWPVLDPALQPHRLGNDALSAAHVDSTLLRKTKLAG
ncbi:MAG: alpha-1,2-mannosyltransferase [Myxococcota bacterium]|jgi:alpha-1,2-mannosyltransferase